MQVEQASTKKKWIDDRWIGELNGKAVLVGSKCAECGKIFFPAKEVCPECFAGNMALAPISMQGTLHTFSRSEMGVPEIEAPYVFGFIDLPEKIKLFGMITDCDPWDEVLKIGMEMEVFITSVRRDQAGNEIMAYKFRPLGGNRT